MFFQSLRGGFDEDGAYARWLVFEKLHAGCIHRLASWAGHIVGRMFLFAMKIIFDFKV